MKNLLPALLLAVSSGALAQYSGPGVETCVAYAKAEIKREGTTTAKDVVIERDGNLNIARYTRKLGNQFVSSVLTGNGAVVLDGSPSAELSFICLLADEKRAVFFEWLPRGQVSPLAQCTRDKALRAKPRPCLEVLLQVAENDLTIAYTEVFLNARQRDTSAGNDRIADAFRKSNEEWKQYRDAECARRRDHTPAGISPDDALVACQVELTRRRTLDVR